MKKETLDRRRGIILGVLTKHIGGQKAIDMGELFSLVLGKEYKGSKINGTRELRRIITELRKEGIPICSATAKVGGGYYLPAVASELEGFLQPYEKIALQKLYIISRIKNIGLKELLGQMELELEG